MANGEQCGGGVPKAEELISNHSMHLEITTIGLCTVQ